MKRWATDEQKRDIIAMASQCAPWCEKMRKYADANYVETMDYAEAQRVIRKLCKVLEIDGGGEEKDQHKEKQGHKGKAKGLAGARRAVPEPTPEMLKSNAGKIGKLLELPCLQ